MEKIASFSVDHDKIAPGMYISRIDGDVTTFDLRTRRPNGGDYMKDRAIHTVEHMLATYLRGGSIGAHVLYFGPMGCRTGFYLLTRGLAPEVVRAALIEALEQTLRHEGAVFGASRRECGNYRALSLTEAKRECAAYLAVLKDQKGGFSYAE